jgi:hypothetical protein
MRGLFSIFLFCICNGALAQHNPRPRLIPIGCNFDGGLAWLALGKAAAGPELESFQVEISDVDLESVEATISPSKMDMFMPYGLGPVVGPINVASASISPRNIDGVLNGNVVTIRFNILSSYSTPTEFLQPGSISYILVLNNKGIGCRR